MAQGLELKINVRHSDTGGKIRTVKNFTNFTFNQKFNSMASTFSFDFFFDPKNKEHAEIVCVSHMHEALIYYNGTLELTGFILAQKFVNNGKPQLVNVSGYAKAGVFGDCDIPHDLYPLEITGLTFRQIIQKIIKPFNIGLVIEATAKGVNKTFVASEKDVEEKSDEDMGKTAAESSQNIASYLSDLAKQRNIVLSHNAKGQVLITTPNTKGTPILNFDFTEGAEETNNDAKKIPGIELEMEFNGQALHTHITVVQQSDDEEGSNAAQTTIKNPLIPIKQSVLYRPKTVIISSGNDNTVNEVALYELGREIREAVVLKIKMPKIAIEEKMINPNNTVTVRDPVNFLYNRSTWFIQSIDTSISPNEEIAVLSCVLPYGYDFDLKNLKNVFVDPHQNLPRF